MRRDSSWYSEEIVQLDSSWYSEEIVQLDSSWYSEEIVQLDSSWYSEEIVQLDSSWYSEEIVQLDSSWYSEEIVQFQNAPFNVIIIIFFFIIHACHFIITHFILCVCLYIKEFEKCASNAQVKVFDLLHRYETRGWWGAEGRGWTNILYIHTTVFIFNHKWRDLQKDWWNQFLREMQRCQPFRFGRKIFRST